MTEGRQIRVGLINKGFYGYCHLTRRKYFPNIQAPYGAHITVPLKNMLGALENYKQWIPNALLQYTTTLDRSSENSDPLGAMYDMYRHANTVKKGFPYALTTNEIDGKYKYPFVYDIDGDFGDSKEKLEELLDMLERDLVSLGTDVGEWKCWFTGKKGFRLVYVPYYKTTTLRFPEDPFKHTKQYQDVSIYHKGHGVKFDLFPHPGTGKIPRIVILADLQEPSRRTALLQYILNPDLRYTDKALQDLQTIAVVWQYLYIFFNTEPGLPVNITAAVTRSKTASNIQRDYQNVTINSDPACPLQKVEFSVNYSREFQGVTEIKLTTAKKLGCCYIFPIMAPGLICPVHKRVHTRADKVYLKYYTGSSKIGICCFHPDPPTIDAVKHVNFVDVPSEIEIDNIVLPQHKTLTGETLVLEKCSKRFLDDLVYDILSEDTSLLFLRSGMGSGKTVSIASYINHIDMIDPRTRVLVVSTRRACSGMFVSAYGCASYLHQETQTVRKDLHKLRKVVVSMESLHRLANPQTNEVEAFDIIVLDEIESILSTFNGSTMDERRINFLYLLALLKSPRSKIVAADAFLGPKTLNFFHNTGIMAEKKCKFVVNTFNRDDSIYYLYNGTSSKQWLKALDEAIEQDLKIVIVSDKLQLLRGIKEKIREKVGIERFDNEKRSILITSGSSQEDLRTSIDTEKWEDLDYIFYSPVITVGNSYSPSDTELFKDAVFGVHTGTTTVLTFMQMMGRFRETKQKKKHVLCTANIQRETPADAAVLEEYILNNRSLKSTQLLTGEINEESIFVVVDRQSALTLKEEDTKKVLVFDRVYNDLFKVSITKPYLPFTRLYVENVLEHLNSRYYPKETWPLHFVRANVKYVNVDFPGANTVHWFVLAKEFKNTASKYTLSRKRSREEIEVDEEAGVQQEILSPLISQNMYQHELKQVRDLFGHRFSEPLLGTDPDKQRILLEILDSHIHVDCLEVFRDFHRCLELPKEAARLLLEETYSSKYEYKRSMMIIMDCTKGFYEFILDSMVKKEIDGKQMEILDVTSIWLDEVKRHFFIEYAKKFCENKNVWEQYLFIPHNTDSAIVSAHQSHWSTMKVFVKSARLLLRLLYFTGLDLRRINGKVHKVVTRYHSPGEGRKSKRRKYATHVIFEYRKDVTENTLKLLSCSQTGTDVPDDYKYKEYLIHGGLVE